MKDKIKTQIYNYTGKDISSDIVGEKCSFENCQNKVEVVLSVNDKIRGLPVEKLYPVCKKHKEIVLKGTAPNSD